MGFYFRKTKKISDGVRLNLSKTGPSISVGKRGGTTFNFSARGMSVNKNLGNGMRYRQTFGGSSRSHQSAGYIPSYSSSSSVPGKRRSFLGGCLHAVWVLVKWVFFFLLAMIVIALIYKMG